jgi:hypothetical protein
MSNIGTCADEGIGTRPEAELVGMCAESRMSTGSTQSFFSSERTRLFRRNRQRDDQHVDARDAGEFD